MERIREDGKKYIEVSIDEWFAANEKKHDPQGTKFRYRGTKIYNDIYGVFSGGGVSLTR